MRPWGSPQASAPRPAPAERSSTLRSQPLSLSSRCCPCTSSTRMCSFHSTPYLLPSHTFAPVWLISVFFIPTSFSVAVFPRLFELLVLPSVSPGALGFLSGASLKAGAAGSAVYPACVCEGRSVMGGHLEPGLPYSLSTACSELPELITTETCRILPSSSETKSLAPTLSLKKSKSVQL